MAAWHESTELDAPSPLVHVVRNVLLELRANLMQDVLGYVREDDQLIAVAHGTEEVVCVWADLVDDEVTHALDFVAAAGSRGYLGDEQRSLRYILLTELVKLQAAGDLDPDDEGVLEVYYERALRVPPGQRHRVAADDVKAFLLPHMPLHLGLSLLPRGNLEALAMQAQEEDALRRQQVLVVVHLQRILHRHGTVLFPTAYPAHGLNCLYVAASGSTDQR